MSDPVRHAPVLPGSGATDYERYLRTDELLSLQKPLDAVVHRDELLFQTIHQTAELWLKLACAEVAEATTQLDQLDGRDVSGTAPDRAWSVVRLLHRASDALDLVSTGTVMLEHLSPSDYHLVRTALGHGSGFDSPGFRRTHEVSAALGEAFERWLSRRGLDVDALLDRPALHPDVFEIAERLLDWDERLIRWRALHLKMVERVIGGHAIGTQGTPVEVLGRLVDARMFPALWDARNRLTERRAQPPASA